jgi:hypothetical protein
MGQEVHVDKGIWVRGTGTAAGPRDQCVITLGAEVRRPTASEALAGAATAVEHIRAALIAGGVGTSELASAGATLAPVYDDYPTVAGFTASVRLTFRTDDIAAVGGLLAAAVEAGGDAARLHEVSFQHADASALVALARERAWIDALARATQLAGLAGRGLGEVLAIDETGGRPPGPRRVAVMAEAASSGAVPLDAGEGSVEVALTVGWALR